jgi:hypothetical protein
MPGCQASPKQEQILKFCLSLRAAAQQAADVCDRSSQKKRGVVPSSPRATVLVSLRVVEV